MQLYIPVFLVLGVSLCFALVLVILNSIIGPKNKTKEKLSTYESGIVPIDVSKSRFSVRYYLVAILFIIFDVEVIFMYPWAITFQDLNLQGILPMAAFIVLMFVGYVYIVRKKILDHN